MSLIVEDGTGKADAESYCDVAYADAYFLARAHAAWAALDTTTKEAYLRIATDFMVANFRMRWKGRRVLITQSLDWPRVGVVLDEFAATIGRNGYGTYGLFQVPYTIVPEEIKKACAEMAIRVITNPELVSDQTQNVLQKTVGPITVKYDQQSPQWKQYRYVDQLVKSYLNPSAKSPMVKMSRS